MTDELSKFSGDFRMTSKEIRVRMCAECPFMFGDGRVIKCSHNAACTSPTTIAKDCPLKSFNFKITLT